MSLPTCWLTTIWTPGEVISAIENRPAEQSVIVTGRGCHALLLELADTVSEIRPVKHAFDRGIQAQIGIDW